MLHSPRRPASPMCLLQAPEGECGTLAKQCYVCVKKSALKMTARISCSRPSDVHHQVNPFSTVAVEELLPPCFRSFSCVNRQCVATCFSYRTCESKSDPGVKETPRKTSPKPAWRRVKKLSCAATVGSVFDRESNTTTSRLGSAP